MKITALITGASRGIGKAIAERYAAEGFDICAPSSAELDLNDAASVSAFIEKNSGRYFGVIVNNAGVNDIRLTEDITDAEMEKMMNVNLVSPIKLIRAFLGKMKENRFGRIVNIGSIWAVVSKPGRLVYSAAKNGIHGVTNTVALEGAAYNVLANTVCPGFTDTELTAANNTKEEIEKICADIPAGRMAKPSEIASLVFYLGSKDNTYITGQKITIDGGFTVK